MRLAVYGAVRYSPPYMRTPELGLLELLGLGIYL